MVCAYNCFGSIVCTHFFLVTLLLSMLFCAYNRHGSFFVRTLVHVLFRVAEDSFVEVSFVVFEWAYLDVISFVGSEAFDGDLCFAGALAC